MAESPTSGKKLQWSWVGISFLTYVVLYLLPIVAVRELVGGHMATCLIGGWIFGGIVIVSALVGFVSRGVTIWEPAIAGAAFVFVYGAWFAFRWPHALIKSLLDLVFPMVIVFLLSLLGAWLGERAQVVFKSKSRGSI